MSNLALYSNGSRPYVSSIAYNHHASRINDGVTPGEEASTSDTVWVSAAERVPQWAAVVLPRLARIERVEVYWGRGRVPESCRAIVVQGWADGAWNSVAAAQIPEPDARTVLAFEPARMEAVRIWQDLAVNLTNNTFRDGKWWYDAPGRPVSEPGRMIGEVSHLFVFIEFYDHRERSLRH